MQFIFSEKEKVLEGLERQREKKSVKEQKKPDKGAEKGQYPWDQWKKCWMKNKFQVK